MAAPPASGALRNGPHERAFRRALPRQSTRLVIGAADRVVAMQQKTLGERGNAVIHRANNDFAAASAPPTIGSGNRMKSIVSATVTSSTNLSSAAIGRSKAPTGSSKKMNLTAPRQKKAPPT